MLRNSIETKKSQKVNTFGKNLIVNVGQKLTDWWPENCQIPWQS